MTKQNEKLEWRLQQQSTKQLSPEVSANVKGAVSEFLIQCIKCPYYLTDIIEISMGEICLSGKPRFNRLLAI